MERERKHKLYLWRHWRRQTFCSSGKIWNFSRKENLAAQRYMWWTKHQLKLVVINVGTHERNKKIGTLVVVMKRCTWLRWQEHMFYFSCFIWYAAHRKKREHLQLAHFADWDLCDLLCLVSLFYVHFSWFKVNTLKWNHFNLSKRSVAIKNNMAK